jgi:hypothetical protein
MNTNNPATGFFGVRVDPSTGKPMECAEHDHFYVCQTCGQAVDMRDLGQVFHHEEPGHGPLALDA